MNHKIVKEGGLNMKVQAGRALLLSFFFMVLYFSHPAFAAQASRIELMDGKVYENITFTVDNEYKIITIKVGDWKQEVSFPDIARIYDQEGKDVTAEYLGEYYRPPQEGQKKGVAEEPRPRRYRKRPFNFGFSAGTNYSFPGGDYYNGITSGLGFGADIIIPVTKNVALRGTISKSGMKVDLKAWAPGFIILEDDLKINAWRYLVCAEYYHWPRWKTGGKVLYYFYTGFGAISHSFSGTATVEAPISHDIMVIYSIPNTQTKFVTTYGGGVIPMISKTVGVDIGAELDVVFVGQTGQTYSYGYYYTASQYATVFDLKIGLVALF
jgi:hypothetical protein